MRNISGGGLVISSGNNLVTGNNGSEPPIAGYSTSPLEEPTRGSSSSTLAGAELRHLALGRRPFLP